MRFFHLFVLIFGLLVCPIEAFEHIQRPIPAFLCDLEQLGYCVIPEVVSREEAESLYERVWQEYIEKAWPKCRMQDRSNWKETFPIQIKFGIIAGPAGQTQVMWDLRQDPRIVHIFAQIWNTTDLIVSMDGLSLMCPPEIREGMFEPWPHVDQAILRRTDKVSHNNEPPAGFVSESSLQTKPFTVQGQFLFEDSLEGDGGFYCIPKSHLRFTEFAPQLETISSMDFPKGGRALAEIAFLRNFFETNSDELGQPYEMKHVTAPKGSLILWDSRTVHWNQHPRKDRTFHDPARVRMVGYLCYVPKARLTEEARLIRKKAFDMGTTTGHNPAWPEIKGSCVNPAYLQYREDPSYVQPTLYLTPLGEALLGIETAVRKE